MISRTGSRIPPGWAAFLWIGALVALVVAGVLGRVLERHGSTEPPTPPPATAPPATAPPATPQPTPEIAVFEPVYDAPLYTWSPIRVTGRTRGTPSLTVTITVDASVIGQVSVVAGAAGAFSVSVPILPPTRGGWADVTVTSGSGSSAPVRVALEPSGSFLVWAPEPGAAPAFGRPFELIGFARSTVPLVHLALSLVDGQPFSELDAAPEPATTGIWRRFTASLRWPAGTPCGDVVLRVTAGGPGGEAFGLLELPLVLPPDASTCRP
jgi:hypothetical protein